MAANPPRTKMLRIISKITKMRPASTRRKRDNESAHESNTQPPTDEAIARKVMVAFRQSPNH